MMKLMFALAAAFIGVSAAALAQESTGTDCSTGAAPSQECPGTGTRLTPTEDQDETLTLPGSSGTLNDTGVGGGSAGGTSGLGSTSSGGSSGGSASGGPLGSSSGSSSSSGD